MFKRKREVFAPTDGVLRVMAETPARLERGVDFSGTDGLEELVRLDFRSTRLRTEDLALAESEGVRVTRKVVCRLPPPGVDAARTVAIGGDAYEVTRTDQTTKHLTLFLDQLTCDGTCELLDTTSSTDARGEVRRTPTEAEAYVRRARMGDRATSKTGVSAPWPTLALTLRACDWRGERQVRYKGSTYAVTASKGDGEWVELTCEQGMVER